MCPEAVFSWLCFWACSGPCFLCMRRARESAEMVTEITDKHGGRKIRLNSGHAETQTLLHFSGRHIHLRPFLIRSLVVTSLDAHHQLVRTRVLPLSVNAHIDKCAEETTGSPLG
jgi:hypothetical protein